MVANQKKIIQNINLYLYALKGAKLNKYYKRYKQTLTNIAMILIIKLRKQELLKFLFSPYNDV